MRTPLGAARRTTLAALLALASITCSGDPVGPGTGHSATVRFTPVLTTGVQGFGLPLDNVIVTVVRPAADTLTVVTAPFSAGDSVLQLNVPVELLVESESLSVTLQLFSGPTLLFTGTDTIEVTIAPGGSTPPPLALDYVGPGADIAFLNVVPNDTVLTFGDSLFFGADAANALEQPVALFYLNWSTTAPGVAIRSDGLIVAPAVRQTIRIAAWTPSGAVDTTDLTFVPVPTQLLKISGDLQTGAIADTLSSPFVVEVRAADNLPVEGIAVTFGAVTAGGVVLDTVVLTDSVGRAGVVGVLGGAAQAYSYSATVAGLTPVTFQATASVAAVDVVVIAGTPQTDTVGRALPLPFVVEVRQGGTATPLAGKMVHWSILYGGGILGADSTLSDSLGRAQIGYTLDTLLALGSGFAEVLADVVDPGANAIFQVVKHSELPTQVVAVTGMPDTATVGALLVPQPAVRLRDVYGNDVGMAGVTIQAITNSDYLSPPPPSVGPGGLQYSGSAAGTDTAVTDGTGLATFSGLYVDGTVGPEVMRFRPLALGGVSHALDPFFLAAGGPSSVLIVAGDGQSAFVDSAVAVSPEVLVVDLSGNPVAGVTVDFVATGGGGSVVGGSVLTDSLGHATVGSWTLGSAPGPNTLEAQVAGATPAVFTATAQPLTPTIILQLVGTSVVGVGRSAPVEVRLSSPAPVGGVVVSFASDAPSVVSVDSASVAFNQNDTLRYLTITGVAVGTANILASAPGYEPDTLPVTGSLNLISLPTTLNVPYGANTSIAVTLGQPAPAGGVVVTLISSDSTKVGIVTPTVNIPQGQTSANGTVYGTALGTATVAATNPNYAPDASIVSTTATLNIVNASQTIYSSIPITQTLEFRSAGALIAAPAGGVVASLTSLDTTCVTVPATATITAGLSSTTFTPTYGGTAPLVCTTKVLATYPGVDPDSISITVNPPPGSTLTTTDVGSGLATYAYGYLETGVPTPRNMVIRSLDTTKVLVTPIDTAVGRDSAVFFLGVGETFRYYYIRGKEGIVNDSALIELSAPGYVTSTGWVRVRAPGVVLAGFPTTTTSLSAPTALSAYVGLSNAAFTGIQAYQGLRPGGTLGNLITFTVTPSAYATLKDSSAVQDTVKTATLVPGQYYTGNLAQGGVQYVPLGAGSTALSVAAPGYLTLSLPGTTVISAPTSTVTVTDVGSGLATYAYGYLETGVPTPRNMVIRSLDTTKVLVTPIDTAVGRDSAVYALAAGESFRYYYIRGKEGIVNDSAQVELSAPGYLTSTAWVRVRAPGVVLAGFPATTTTLSAPTALSAYVGLPNTAFTAIQAYQGLRPGGTLGNLITFTVTPSAYATLKDSSAVQDTVKTATLVPGQYYTGNLAQGGVQYVPLGAGSTALSIAAPGYLTLSTPGTTVISAPTSTLTAADVGSGLATYAYGYLETSVPTPRNMVIRSLDTTKVLVTPIDTAVGRDSAVFALAVGESFRYYYIRGKEGIVNDSAQVELSAPGYLTSTAWVRVRQPGVVLGSFPGTATTLAPPTALSAYVGLPNLSNTAIQAYQGLRPGGTLASVVTFVVTPSGLATLMNADSVQDTLRTAPLVPGQYYTGSLAQGGVQYTPLVTGTTVLTVTLPGYVSLPGATGSTTISTPGISISSPGTVGAGLQNYGYFSLGASHHGGVNVVVKSSNPSVALVAPNNTTAGTDSVVIFLAEGQNFAYFYVQGVDGAAGTPILTVRANGFVDATAGVTIVPPGVTISNVPVSMTSVAADQAIWASVGVPNGTNTGLSSVQERRAGGTPLTVTFTSGNPAAATLANTGGPGTPLTATIAAGLANSPTSVAAGGVAVRPVAPGSSVISAAITGFIAQTTATATVSVTP